MKNFLRRLTALRSIRHPLSFGAIGVVLVFGVAYVFFASAPHRFPVGQPVIVSAGGTLRDVAHELHEQGAIRSPAMFAMLVRAFGREQAAAAGEYFFEEPENILHIASRISSGMFGAEPTRITIPEGSTREAIAALLDELLENFDADLFLSLTRGREGYLFPDTYFVVPSIKTEDVVRMLETTFIERVSGLSVLVEEFGYPFEDVVIMASLLEREAYRHDVRRKIAGVLWNRIEIGMPLQVDAAFLYINGKSTFDLSRDDLATTSPYNTYVHTGLPPTPIGSPSLEAIEAAATPIESDNFYYLAGRDGETYFAETFEGHKANRVKYLD